VPDNLAIRRHSPQGEFLPAAAFEQANPVACCWLNGLAGAETLACTVPNTPHRGRCLDADPYHRLPPPAFLDCRCDNTGQIHYRIPSIPQKTAFGRTVDALRGPFAHRRLPRGWLRNLMYLERRHRVACEHGKCGSLEMRLKVLFSRLAWHRRS